MHTGRVSESHALAPLLSSVLVCRISHRSTRWLASGRAETPLSLSPSQQHAATVLWLLDGLLLRGLVPRTLVPLEHLKKLVLRHRASNKHEFLELETHSEIAKEGENSLSITVQSCYSSWEIFILKVNREKETESST